jgi:hypothetical protein
MLGIRRIMFAVDDTENVAARWRVHGAELVGEIAQDEDAEAIMVGTAAVQIADEIPIEDNWSFETRDLS